MVIPSDQVAELQSAIEQARPDLTLYRLAKTKRGHPTLAVLDYDEPPGGPRVLRGQVNLTASYIKSGPMVGRAQIVLSVNGTIHRRFSQWPIHVPAIVHGLTELLATVRAQGEYKVAQQAILDQWRPTLTALQAQLGHDAVLLSFKGLQPIVTLRLRPFTVEGLTAVLAATRGRTQRTAIQVSLHLIPIDEAAALVTQLTPHLQRIIPKADP